MAPDQAAPVPAGWYPDPYATSELRWWDGVNWTDSVHPPIAPEPPAAPPVAPPAVPQQPEPAPLPEPVPPVTEQPSAPHQPVAAPLAPPQAAPEPTPAPQQPVPAVQPTPSAAPEPTPAPLVEPAPAPLVADGPAADTSSPVGPLPSRRELRARNATPDGDHSGPASAPTAVPPTPVPESSAPSAFDWLPGGAALGTGAPAAPPTAAPVVAPSPPEPAPAESAPTGPVPATSAWAQEPAAAAAVDDLYSRAATRKATISGWFIAIMPLLAGILSIAAVKGAENYPRYLPFEWWMLVAGVLVILYLVTLLLAVADRSKLDWAGYDRPAHWAWALLTAPVYLLVRTIAVKRETGRTSALLWVWLVLAAALVGAWFATDYFMPELLAPYTLPFL